MKPKKVKKEPLGEINKIPFYDAENVIIFASMAWGGGEVSKDGFNKTKVKYDIEVDPMARGFIVTFQYKKISKRVSVNTTDIISALFDGVAEFKSQTKVVFKEL